MTQPDEDLAWAASSAFGRGDFSALQNQFFAENIIWHVVGTGPFAGHYEGITQVMGVLSKISELCGGTVETELHDVLVSNDHTVALATIRAEQSGKQLQLNIVHVIHSENGMASEVWTYSSDPTAAADFWA
ncbi:MAG: nuclear transport factor 2 family protein [Streptosporangiaceae bacterium]